MDRQAVWLDQSGAMACAPLYAGGCRPWSTAVSIWDHGLYRSRSAIVKARPLWDTHWLPVMFVLTGLVAAAGLVILINRLMTGNHEEVNEQGLKVIFVTMILAALVAALWISEGITGFSRRLKRRLHRFNETQSGVRSHLRIARGYCACAFRHRYVTPPGLA